MPLFFPTKVVRILTGLVLSLLSVSLIAAPLLQRGTEQSGASQTANTGADETSALVSYELFKQLEAIQLEVQRLRGMLEEQNYEIERLKKAEKERYADLDRRMNEIQQRGSLSPQSISVSGSNSEPETIPSVSAVMDEDLKTYSSAKQKVDSKEYNAAIAEFTLYLEFFPQGKYVPQAHYWLGELYMALAIPENDNAKKHFEIVVKEFSSHAKVPDCLYKIGLIQKAQNKKDAARATFQKLLNDFPKSATSSLAKTQLDTL